MQLDSLYQEIILDHYKNPHGVGLHAPFDGEAFHVNTSCGDEVTVRVSLVDQVVTNMTHDGVGCSISRASASVLHDLVFKENIEKFSLALDNFVELMHSKGKTAPDENILGDAAAFVGVSQYPARVKCALLAWMALKDAIEGARR